MLSMIGPFCLFYLSTGSYQNIYPLSQMQSDTVQASTSMYLAKHSEGSLLTLIPDIFSRNQSNDSLNIPCTYLHISSYTILITSSYLRFSKQQISLFKNVSIFSFNIKFSLLVLGFVDLSP